MKTISIKFPLAAAALAGMVCCVAGQLHAAAPAVTPQTEFTPPKSVFVWNQADPAFGRDPFFPNSAERSGRWAPKPKKVEPIAVVPTVKPVENTTPVVKPVENITPPVEKPVEYPLTLTGIGGTRSAIINNITFLKGEKVRVPTALGLVAVRLDEIRENSVVVTVIAGGKEHQQVVPLVGQ